MRIGIVTTSYPRGEGDFAGAWVAEHARWLVGQGHAVEVVAGGPPGVDGDDADAGVPVIRIASPLFRGGAPEAIEAGGGAVPAAAFSLRLVAALARRARRWDAAVAHWLAPSALAVRLTAPRLPLVAIAHSGDVHLLARLRLAAPAAALLAGARLVFVSAALRERMAAAVPAPLRRRIAAAAVQPMGLDVARFAAARAAASTSTAGTPTVGFLGRLVPIKGADLLVAAAARLRGPVRVLVAGDGPEAAALSARAAAVRPLLRSGVSLDLVGPVAGAQRDRFLAAADVVVVPSRRLPGGRTEGSPRVALEAMAAGAAVIAARIGGLAELPASAASLFEPDSPAALAAAITAVLADRAALARLRAGGADLAAAHDWSAVGPRLTPPGAVDAPG